MEFEGWSNFFLASAGAAAALAGLVVVAVSVNVGRILKYRQLPARAGAAVAGFVAVLLVSLMFLAGQPSLALGIEATFVAGCAWLLHVHAGWISVRSARHTERPTNEAIRALLRGQVQGLPLLIGGVLLLLGSPAAIYMVFAGILAVFVLSMFEAWILLIEILR